MNAIEAIMNRKSIRKFTDKHISDDDIDILLRAAMSGPSSVNARPWSFIVVKQKKTLLNMAEAIGNTAFPLKNADMGIIICGDLERAYPIAPEYWIVDSAIAGQNIILAAEELGLGSVWLGIWPEIERSEAIAELFELPKSIIPHSIIAFGYPDPSINRKTREKYEADRVHFERWDDKK